MAVLAPVQFGDQAIVQLVKSSSVGATLLKMGLMHIPLCVLITQRYEKYDSVLLRKYEYMGKIVEN
jgi:hypothetical protein